MGVMHNLNKMLPESIWLKILAWVWIVLGICMSIISIAMFIMMAKDPRGHHIATYNTAVDHWTGSGYRDFSNTKMAFNATGQNGQGAMDLVVATDPDPIKDHDKKIHTYSQYLRYTNYGDVLKNPTKSTGDSIRITNIESGSTTLANVRSVKLYSQSPSALGCTYSCGGSTGHSSHTCVDSYECQRTCSRRNGYYSFNYCYYAQYLTEVGIEIMNTGTFPSGNANVVYQFYGENNPDTGEYNPPAINVTVRSVDDPYITLVDVTDGTLKFGFSAKQYMQIGITFVVVGGLTTILFIALIVMACQQQYNCFGECGNKMERMSSYT